MADLAHLINEPGSWLRPGVMMESLREKSNRIANFGPQLYKVLGLPTSPMEGQKELIFGGLNPEEATTDQIREALIVNYGVDEVLLPDIRIRLVMKKELKELGRLPVSLTTGNGLRVAEHQATPPLQDEPLPPRDYSPGAHVLGQLTRF